MNLRQSRKQSHQGVILVSAVINVYTLQVKGGLKQKRQSHQQQSKHNIYIHGISPTFNDARYALTLTTLFHISLETRPRDLTSPDCGPRNHIVGDIRCLVDVDENSRISCFVRSRECHSGWVDCASRSYVDLEAGHIKLGSSG